MPISEQLTLPSGYGSPNQLLDWTVVEQRLVDSLHYWLATVRRDGTPHVVPLDGIWLDGVCYFGGDPRPYTSGTYVGMAGQRCTWRMGSRRSSSKATPSG